MRFLLIAYDFPPTPSPQALRWAYMVRELAQLGHEVHVLTVDLPGYGPGGLPVIPPQVKVHRCYPGPLSAFLLLGRRRVVASRPNDSDGIVRADPVEQRAASETHPSELNWKGVLAEALKNGLSWCVFPDYRAEWLPWARRATSRLIRELKPDCVVTSHEPASSLPLGLHAKKQGCCWIADLGDPVLASYTSWRWKWRAARLERQVCLRADLVSVTSDGTAALLQRRHGLDATRCLVSPQGFDQSYKAPSGVSSHQSFSDARLELLYTGSFYSFRRAETLLNAVVATPGVRLNIATSKAPAYILEVAAKHPQSVRVMGFLSHTVVLDLQRRCDVLVSIANADPVQVPGKFNEYLGAGRPILHISATEADAVEALVDGLKLGWHVPSETQLIGNLLVSLNQRKLFGDVLCPGRNEAAISRFSWSTLTGLWAQRVTSVVLKAGTFPPG